LEIRIARLQKQESALRESMQALQAKLQGALKQ
jgi:chaperonin cofactor prefoldin